jgi:hypothetical protein
MDNKQRHGNQANSRRLKSLLMLCKDILQYILPRAMGNRLPISALISLRMQLRPQAQLQPPGPPIPHHTVLTQAMEALLGRHMAPLQDLQARTPFLHHIRIARLVFPLQDSLRHIPSSTVMLLSTVKASQVQLQFKMLLLSTAATCTLLCKDLIHCLPAMGMVDHPQHML